MPNGSRRWYVLTGVALLNLALWVGIGGLVCLLVTDGLDLGVETLVRQGQATAVAAWAERSGGGDIASASSAGRSAQAPVGGALATPGALSPALSGRPAAGASVATPTALPPSTAEATGIGSGTSLSLPPAQHPWATPVDGPAGPAEDSPAPEENELSPAAGMATSVPAAALASQSPTVPALDGSASLSGGPAGTDPVVTPQLSRAPLLLADPVFSDLSQLNTEMARSAAGRPVQIRYAEGALNREIDSSMDSLAAADPGFPYRDIHIDIKRDRVIVTGEVTVLTFDVLAQVEGTVVARACVPQLEIESLSLGGIMTPRFVRGRVEEMVLEAMAWYPADYPLCIEEIVLEENRATLYGHRR